jgi:hypothetical protein
MLTSAPSDGRPPAPLPFVGRRQELTALERHLRGAGPPLLVLTGEPGIGKTRLLREGYALAGLMGLTVLEGGCAHRGGQDSYAPTGEAVERYLERLTPSGRHAALRDCAWLVRLLPELASVLAAIAPLPAWTVSPAQEHRLMVKAVSRVLANVAGPGGTLLLLDDLQWAGSDALALLAALARPFVGALPGRRGALRAGHDAASRSPAADRGGTVV